MTFNEQRCVDACNYLDARTGKYEWRAERYSRAGDLLRANGLTDNDLLVDLGAGATEFDYYMRTAENWRGRYWPIDAAFDGCDIADWQPRPGIDWIVALEFIEHITEDQADELIDRCQRVVRKGIILSTPNPETTDVLGMDETHLWEVPMLWLQSRGFTVKCDSLYGQEDDSYVAHWMN